MNDSGAASWPPRVQIFCFWEAERMLPAKIAMRQRPVDLRSSWKCQGRASDWLRTFTEGMRMPRVRCEARDSCDVAE